MDDRQSNWIVLDTNRPMRHSAASRRPDLRLCFTGLLAQPVPVRVLRDALEHLVRCLGYAEDAQNEQPEQLLGDEVPAD